MEPFVHEPLPTRVVFGDGTVARVKPEIDRLGVLRALVLSTPGRGERLANEVAGLLGKRSAGVFAGAVMHTPVEATERALRVVADLKADAVVAVGGGSTTGLGKAIALRTDLPQLVLPTTYAGSEVTPILGETRDGRKTTQRTRKVLPEVVVYDVDLTLDLPVAVSAASGMNAIAHAVEALYAPDRNPVVSLLAEQGIAALARALPRIAEEPRDRAARGDALYGAYLCGTCLGAVGMALHHKLCHALGGAFDLPHAETHAAVLPHAVAYNAGAAPEAMRAVARALGTGGGAATAAVALYALAGRLGVKRALRDLGMPASGVDLVADRAVAEPYPNPRPLEREAVRLLLARAWSGEPPRL